MLPLLLFFFLLLFLSIAAENFSRFSYIKEKASFVKLQNSLLDARKFCKIYKTDFIILQRLNFCEN